MTSVRRGVVLQGVDTVDEFLAMASHIEATGFDHLWLTESSLHARDPYQLLALAARATTRLRLGTAVTNPVTRHPALTAVAAATLAEIAGDRAILGIGAGDRPLMALGAKPARLAELEAAIAAIRALLAGESVTADEPGFRLVDAHLRFDAKADLPVFVSASGPRTLELAGAVADGVILLCGLDPAVVQWALDRVDEGARSAGRPRPHIAIFVYGVIDEDEPAAIAGARSIAAWFPQTAPIYCDLVGLDPAITRAVRESYSGGEFQEAAQAASLLPESFVQRMAVAGNRDRVTAQLAALRQVGVDSINILPLGDDRMATINAFDECWRRL
ncbi:MAG: LLM class flavin-dependent oxidoreductase [Acidimicrobiaceae bacterium]|nr:LLM class flavin-dependent oxidoreductase [Acidimicrobiaceae bacterium]MYE65285.1 LLM class flavin-dependent oxidoreductase [Acidimicrobiaceae bacterium]MYJ41090.1 LLM class flavin-dependent oxidoreductase [Acidimicrobiaceae bacterium]